MLTFIKTLAVMAGMILIIPLTVWAGSGSLRTAWYATKRYCLIMAFLFGAGMLISSIYYLSTLGAS